MDAVIPQTSPLASYQAKAEEIDAAVAKVLHSGHYLLGPETEAFEKEFAAYVGAAHGIGAGSGTEALHLALSACGIGPGDEVITVSHTAVATVAAIDLCGAKPVLVDIDPRNFNLEPARLEAACTDHTRAVVRVHLYGQAADLDPVLAFCREHGLRLIEDCAQAHGALYGGRRVGSFGDAAAFSFYPTKNLGAIGDGGMAVTSDAALAAEMRSLRQYGWKQQRYISEQPGWNGRIDELQAAILRVKLRGLEADNERRCALAAIYTDTLTGVPGLELPREQAGKGSVWHQYVIRSARRDALADALRADGIQTLVHYPMPIHLQPAYAERGLAVGPMRETERAAPEVLSLPMYPELGTAQVERVAQAVLDFFLRVEEIL
jgi:dTDP-4-amino-4,6-dideoxygalactose transaminase